MKKNILLFIVMLGSLLIMGCGPSLKEYMAASSNYNSRVATTKSVTVDIEPNNVVGRTSNRTANIIGGVLNVAASVGASAMSAEQEQRLQSILKPDEMASLVSVGFEDGFSNSTHLEYVENTQNPDIRIFLTLNRYGVWAESLLSPMKFFVEADVRIVYAPSMTTIYTSGVSMMREASDMFSEIANQLSADVSYEVHGSVPRVRRTRLALDTVNNVGNLVAGAGNLTAFLKLTDDEIKMIFNYLAYNSGVSISERLIRAIYY